MIENNLNKKSDLRNVNFEKSGDNPGGIVQSFPFPGRWYNFQFLPCRKLFFELFVHLWSQLYHTRKTELVPVWWQKRKKVNNIIVVVDLLSECHFISVHVVALVFKVRFLFCVINNNTVSQIERSECSRGQHGNKKKIPISSHFSLFKLSLILSVCYTMGSQSFWSRIVFDTLLRSHDTL